jgi:AdoMet-dependent heme synthase
LTTPYAPLQALDTVWFQVAGTLCNLACTHCLVSSSPTNRTHEGMTLEEIRPYLDEAVRLGARDYYFTGGEPFLNPELHEILEAALEHGPATVLTNGLLLSPERCTELRRIAERSRYSLDFRVSLDGVDAASNDAIRGRGTFERALAGVRNLSGAGFVPVLTVTEASAGAGSAAGRERFLQLLRENGIERARLKILPLFRIGAESSRGGPYPTWQSLADVEIEPAALARLQCSSGRMVTDQGVWVCPILVNEPEARMGRTLAESLAPYPLRHAACWTCHVEGATCRT